MNRQQLLQEIYAARARLEAVLERLTPAQMTEPGLPCGWSVKDLLAHLAYWQQRGVEGYQEALQTGQPARPQNAAELDSINDRILADFRARDLEDVRVDEQAAYHSLLQFIETTPESELCDPQRFPQMAGEPLMQWILDNSGGHFDEHLPDLLAFAPLSEKARR